MSSSKTSDASTEDQVQYDWGTGKSKWEDYQIAHGHENTEIPKDWPDQQLIKWVNQTRRDYWRCQNGENTVSQIEKGRFRMLGLCGFDFGPNGKEEDDEEPPKTEKPSAEEPTKNKPATESRSNNASASPTPTVASTEATDSTSKAAAAASQEPAKNPATEGRSRNASSITPTTIASTDEAADSTSKAAAADCASQKSSSGAVEAASSTKRKRDEDDTDTDEQDEQEETSIQAAEEEEGDSKPAPRRSRRKIKKTESKASLPAPPPARTRYSRRARTAPKSSVSSKALVASTGKRKASAATSAAAASSKQAKRKKTKQYKPLEMLRVIPEEREDEVRQQIRKECAKLLKSQEPLKADEAKRVSSKLAKSNNAWEERFLDFLVFRRVYNHSIVPKYFAENQKLAQWTSSNRHWFKHDDPRMTKSRKKRLDQAEFVWDAKKDPTYLTKQNQTTKAAEKWTRLYNALLAFKQEFGDCLVPKEWGPNMELSYWVCKQRKQRKNKIVNKPNSLTDEQEKKLEDAGFVWNARSKEHLRQAMLRANQAGAKGNDSAEVDGDEVDEEEAALAEGGDEVVAGAMEVNDDGEDDNDDDTEDATLAEDAEVAVAAASVADSLDAGDLDDDGDTDTEDEEEPDPRPGAMAKPSSIRVEAAAMPKKAPVAVSLETGVEKETSKDPAKPGAEKPTLQADDEEKKSDDIEALVEEPSADDKDEENAVVVESEAHVTAAKNDKASRSDGDKATAAVESIKASDDEGNAMIVGDKTEDKAAEGTDKTPTEVAEVVNDIGVETASAKQDDKIVNTKDAKAPKKRESKTITSEDSTNDVEDKNADPTSVAETSVATMNGDGAKVAEKVLAKDCTSTSKKGEEEEAAVSSIENKTAMIATEESKAVGMKKAKKVAVTTDAALDAKSSDVGQGVEKDRKVSAVASSAKEAVDDTGTDKENTTAPPSVTEKEYAK